MRNSKTFKFFNNFMIILVLSKNMLCANYLIKKTLLAKPSKNMNLDKVKIHYVYRYYK